MFSIWLRKFLPRVSASSHPGRRQHSCLGNRGYRPRIEALEDRTLPTVNWIGGSGNWNDTSH
jgi:hypothetical protein